MAGGRLFYVIGASGVGKDALIRRLRRAGGADAGLMLARRVVTRGPDPDGEDHQPVTDAMFEALSAAGAFALDWRSHGLRYGIGVEVETWLRAGADVAANGSRAALAAARARFASLVPVVVVAEPATVAARLVARGREGPAARAERLARLSEWTPPADARVLRNDGELEQTVAAFLALTGR